MKYYFILNKKKRKRKKRKKDAVRGFDSLPRVYTIAGAKWADSLVAPRHLFDFFIIIYHQYNHVFVHFWLKIFATKNFLFTSPIHSFLAPECNSMVKTNERHALMAKNWVLNFLEQLGPMPRQKCPF